MTAAFSPQVGIAWVVFDQVTSTSYASFRLPEALMCCLGANIIYSTTWQMLSDWPHCLWDGNQILLGWLQQPWHVGILHGRVGIRCLYVGSGSDRIQCDIMQIEHFAGLSVTQNSYTCLYRIRDKEVKRYTNLKSNRN